MNSRYRSRLTNPLIQRLRRHTSASVLFGSTNYPSALSKAVGNTGGGLVQAEPFAPGLYPAESQPGRPLVGASLMPASAFPQDAPAWEQPQEPGPIEEGTGAQDLPGMPAKPGAALQPRAAENTRPAVSSRPPEERKTAAAINLPRDQAPAAVGHESRTIQPARSAPAAGSPRPGPAPLPPEKSSAGFFQAASNLPSEPALRPAAQPAPVQPKQVASPGSVVPRRPAPPVPPAGQAAVQRKPETAAQPPALAPTRQDPNQKIEPETPTVPEVKDPEEEKRIWGRLQNIFRKHKEKEEMEAKAEPAPVKEAAPASAPVQRRLQPKLVEEPDKVKGAEAVKHTFVEETSVPKESAGQSRASSSLPESAPESAGPTVQAPMQRSATEAAPASIQRIPSAEQESRLAAPGTPPPPRAAVIAEEPTPQEPPAKSSLPQAFSAVPPASRQPPPPSTGGEPAQNDFGLPQEIEEPASEIVEPAQPADSKSFPQPAASAASETIRTAPTLISRKPEPASIPEGTRPTLSGRTARPAAAETASYEAEGEPPDLAPETQGQESLSDVIEPEPSPTETHLQSLPLEAVWPVETVQTPLSVPRTRLASQAPGRTAESGAVKPAIQRQAAREPVKADEANLAGDVNEVRDTNLVRESNLVGDTNGLPEADSAREPSLAREPSYLDGADSLHQALSGVTPGQPTESSVELITPRKPRPVSSSASKTPPSGEQPRAVVQREQAAGALEAAAPEAAAPEAAGMPPLPESTPAPEAMEDLPASAGLPARRIQASPEPSRAPQPPPQRKQEGAPISKVEAETETPAFALEQPGDSDSSSPETPRSHMIETAIGPLPSDLWDLIGEQPPSRPREPAMVQPKSAGETPVHAGETLVKASKTPDAFIPSTAAVQAASADRIPETSGETPIKAGLPQVQASRPPVNASGTPVISGEIPTAAVPLSSPGPALRTVQASPAKPSRASEQEYLTPSDEELEPAAPRSVEFKSLDHGTWPPAPDITAKRGATSAVQRMPPREANATDSIPAQTEQTAVPEPEPEPAPAPAPAAPSGGGVDMDELATKVYSEVKRRFSVEWERLRRRM